MTTTDNPDRYERVWKEHIEELDKIKLSLSDIDDIERIDEIQDELNQLVETVAGEFDDERT